MYNILTFQILDCLVVFFFLFEFFFTVVFFFLFTPALAFILWSVAAIGDMILNLDFILPLPI